MCIKINNTMEDFFRQEAVLVVEEKRFRDKLLVENGGIFTRDQYLNRMSGRTPLSMAERIICKQKLEEVRQEIQEHINQPKL